MDIRTISVLGTPVSYLTKSEAVASILSFLEQGRSNQQPAFVDFLTHDAVVDFSRWRFDEILSESRKRLGYQSDLSISSDPFFSWISAALGNAWHPQFSERELILALLEGLAEKNASVFLLGDNNDKCKAWVKFISVVNHSLAISGTGNVVIPTQGESLETSLERDDLLIEELNSMKIDVLLLDFGEEHQRVWFDRVRSHLKVPLVVSVGHNAALEVRDTKVYSWISDHRNHQQEESQKRFYERLKRPLAAFFKLSYLLVPLVIYQTFSRWFVKSFCETRMRPFLPGKMTKRNILFLSPKKSLSIVVMPVSLDQSNCRRFKQRIEESLDQDIVILDCRSLRYMDLEGVNLIVKQLLTPHNHKSRIVGLGLHPHVRFLLDLNQVWNLVQDFFHHSLEDVEHSVRAEDESAAVYDSFYQEKEEVVLSFFGGLHSGCDYEVLLTNYLQMMQEKDCVLNLAYCTVVSNAGLAFLLKLRSFQINQGKAFVIYALSRKLKRDLRLADLDSLLKEE